MPRKKTNEEFKNEVYNLVGNEYTVICDETNVSLNGYKIISPCGSKKLTKRIK